MLSPLKVRIYLEDTDAGGVVYHTSYLRFMERQRTELLRIAGVQQSQGFTSDVSFVVHQLSVAYRQPAMLDDEVLVDCEFSSSSAARLCLKQTVRATKADTTGATPRVYCEAEVTVACISLETHRPRRIPEELLSAIKAVLREVN